MRINWKKTIIVTLDIILGGYLVVAFSAFGKPNVVQRVCTQVNINIQDEATSGFISAAEIKNRLEKNRLYPLSKLMQNINTRLIEETLEQSPFVKRVECYKTEDGHVTISLTQRMPILRIKAANGEDYYIDDNHSVMPNSNYTSDLIIATGYVSKWYARHYISYLAENLMSNEFWRNQIVQINVLSDRGVELVPRVGNHIVYIGQLPETKYVNMRQKLIDEYVNRKMDRLEKFYKYGLSQAGWNKYKYINIEFDNQIICKKHIE
jgi:cell division protein FtsQ